MTAKFGQSIFVSLLALGTALPAGASAQSHDFTLKIDYQVVCPNQDASAFPGITGEVTVQGRTLRIDLFKYLHSTEMTLSVERQPEMSALQFRWDASPDCRLEHFEPTVVEEAPSSDHDAALAMKHSPYLVVRKDQLTERQRDLPIGVAYSVMPTSQNSVKIRYTMFFSNETVQGLGSTSKATSLARYGRRTDIEWIYDVEFDSEGRVISRHYQSGIIGGLGHSTKRFKGRFLPGTEHPIFFDIAKHNVFGTRGDFDSNGNPTRAAYHLIPREELPASGAREWWQWERPWIFDLNDRELRRGGGYFEAPSNDYLYVLVTGKMKKARLWTHFSKESFFWRGPRLGELGEGLGGKQSFIAIKMTEADQAQGGKISLAPVKTGVLFRHLGTMNLEPLRFFRLKADSENGFMPEEVTQDFRCNSNLECRFGSDGVGASDAGLGLAP